MIKVDVSVVDNASPALTYILSRMTAKGMQTISKRAAVPVRSIIRKHIEGMANTRHKTAAALGATPSNVLNRVASGVRIDETASGDAAVAIPHPMFARAFSDIEITAKQAKALTIPIHAAAYNQAARSFTDLFVWRNTDKDATDRHAFLARSVGTGKNKKLELLYLLVKRVHQPQDRTMLPTDEELGTAAQSGATKYLQAIIARREKRMEASQ